jgi:GrpB-like predicted nucleotidyltransferase (UPF0157 family)
MRCPCKSLKRRLCCREALDRNGADKRCARNRKSITAAKIRKDAVFARSFKYVARIRLLRSLADLFEKGSVVPPPIPVILAAYDPEWPRLAAGHSRRLQALGSALVIVHHIGSTSVPGLAAKPIIDLMPVVSDLAEIDRLRERVEALGYGWHGELGIAGRRYCTLDDQAGARAVQLHIFQVNSPHVERHIALRDYLRAHPEIARAYENEKRRAQSLHPDDSHRYTDEKAAWIRDAEVKALNWYAQQRSLP